MNLRWLFGNFADPQHELSRRDQHRLSNIAHKKYLAKSAFWMRTAIIVVPFVAAYPISATVLRRLGYGTSVVAFAVVYAAIAVLFWPWCAWMYRSLYARPMRMAMRAEGHDVCLSCGYELRGLPPETGQCPECGSKREPMPIIAKNEGEPS